MEWILILVAINNLNPEDKPAKLTMEFPTKESCELASKSIKYEIDFKWYRLDKQCKRNY